MSLHSHSLLQLKSALFQATMWARLSLIKGESIFFRMVYIGSRRLQELTLLPSEGSVKAGWAEKPIQRPYTPPIHQPTRYLAIFAYLHGLKRNPLGGVCSNVGHVRFVEVLRFAVLCHIFPEEALAHRSGDPSGFTRPSRCIYFDARPRNTAHIYF